MIIKKLFKIILFEWKIYAKLTKGDHTLSEVFSGVVAFHCMLGFCIIMFALTEGAIHFGVVAGTVKVFWGSVIHLVYMVLGVLDEAIGSHALIWANSDTEITGRTLSEGKVHTTLYNIRGKFMEDKKLMNAFHTLKKQESLLGGE